MTCPLLQEWPGPGTTSWITEHPAMKTIRLIDKVQSVFGEAVVVDEKENKMGLTDALKAAGYKQEANSDEDFPAFKGEYKVKVTDLKPFDDKDTGEKVGYSLELEIQQTLSGDTVDGRKLWKRYRTAGKTFTGEQITEQDAVKAVQAMLNDLFTMGVSLDTSSDAAMEASLVSARDAVGYIRAWYFQPKGEDRKVQQFIIKLEKDLKKDSKEGGSSSPF